MHRTEQQGVSIVKYHELTNAMLIVVYRQSNSTMHKLDVVSEVDAEPNLMFKPT